MTKLSIIIPTYNVENYIKDCLESLVPQLVNDCELIIVDDGSTDNTVQVTRQYFDKIIRDAEWERTYFIQDTSNPQVLTTRRMFDPVVPWTATMLTSAVNSGVSAARNRGLAEATGEYIAFIDGDDLVTEYYIGTVLNALIEQKKDVYEISWRSFGANHKLRTAGSLPASNCSVWSRIWKRSVILHPFDESKKKSEDRHFLDQNLVEKVSIGYIYEPIYLYRRGRPGSLMTTKE